MRDPAHLLALTGRQIARIGVVTFAAAALFVSVVSGANAQTVPAAPDQTVAAPANAGSATTTAAATTPDQQPVVAQTNPAPRRPAPTPAPLSHWPVIDFVATFTQPAYYLNSVQLINYDPMDLGGTVRFPITRKINLFFDRITEGTIEQPLERALNPANGAPILSAHSRDIILQYHGTYTFDRFLTMDIGDSFRHRVYAYRVATGGTPSSPTFTPLFNLTNISSQPFPNTLNSTEAHYGYLGFTYTTKPWKEFMNSSFAISETVQMQNVDHHVAMLCSAANIAALPTNNCASAGITAANVGLFDERPGTQNYWTNTSGITWIWPIDPRRGVVFTTNWRNGYLNWYENAFFPYHWNTATAMQLSKRFSPGFTLALRHQDLHQAPQGAPFPTPNAIHVGSWDIIGTFHVDTKTWAGQ